MDNKVLLCAIAKQENLYIKEWVEYHLKLGFDHITIYDNNEPDGERISDVVGCYPNVNVIDFRGKHQKSCEMQVAAYNACYKGAGAYDWVMFMDIDEFLWFKDYNSIKPFLEQHWVKKANVIRFHWKCYSDNGKLKYEDLPVMERFTEECKDKSVNYHMKQLYRTNLGTLRIVNVHYTNHVNNIYYPDGKHAPYITTTRDKNIHDSIAHIKHYVTKSLEEYVKIKYARRGVGSSKTRLNLDFYFKYNDKTDEKLKYYKTLINELNDNSPKETKTNKMPYIPNEHKAKSQRTPTPKPVKPQKDIPYPSGVSVCISAWKTAEYIEECLDSVANQTWFKDHDNWEILLGIDGCEETLAKVKEIMHKYKNLNVMMMDKNVGTYVTCNTIMKEAKYEWLLRFDSDDVMYPNMVETLMKKKGDAEFVLFQMRNFGLKKCRDEIQRTYGQHLMNRCVFYRFNGYANWICSADDDLIHKVRKYGKVIVIQEVLMKRRLHKNSLTINEKTNFESQIRKKYADIVHNNDTYSSFKKCKNNQIACYTFKKICPENIIVSFTSWKKRINCCSHIVDLMLKQTMCPNKIILNLSTDEFKNKELDLPKELLEKQNSIFEIHWVKENTKVYKKIMPTLNRFPNDIIITVDDDIEYPSDYIETMYETYVYYGKKHPIAAFKNKEPNYDVYMHSGAFSLIKRDFFKNYLNELYDNVVLKNGIDVMENDDDIYFYASLLAKTTYKIVNDDYLLKINEIYKKSLALNSNPYSIYNDAWRKRREKSINILQKYILEKYKKTYDELLDAKNYSEHTIVYNSCKTPVSGKKYNNEPVIISMTSWKKRINSTHIAIESIISQCEKSHIVLVLSEEEFPLKEKELPVSITRLMELGKIELLWVYDNTKAFKKVIPTMRKYKNVPIISADDDLTYTRDYASELYNTFIKDKSVFCVSYRHAKMITPCGAATLYNPLYYNKIISTFNKRFVTLLEDDMYMQYIIEKNKLKSKFIGSSFPFRTINANDENALSKSYKDGTTALERKNKCFEEYNGTIGAKVVVNITTWAKRDYCLYPMLSNLKKQTRYPDRIVLWLSEEEYDKNKLPRTIQRCVDEKLLTDIMWVKKNTKGHKRYDCFKYFNNCYNILLDDDILYRPKFIEELLNESKKHQDCITVYSSRTIDYIGVRYIEKQFSQTPSHTNVFIAGRCCFPPYIFPFDAYENEELRNEYVLNCDESWYRPFFIKHDIRIHVMHQWDNNYYPEIKESQKNSLWNYNKRILGNGMRDKERNFYNAIKITHTEELCKRIWKNIGIDNYVIQK